MKLMPKIVAAAAALALTGGALTACGSSDAQSDGAQSEGPSRVVLTSHAAANTLDELDLEDNVIGLTKTGVFPDALSTYSGDEFTDVGSLKEPKMDVIAELSGPISSSTGTAPLRWSQSSPRSPTSRGRRPRHLGHDCLQPRQGRGDRRAVRREDAASDKLAEIDDQVAATRGKAENAGTALVLMTPAARSPDTARSRFDLIYNELGRSPSPATSRPRVATAPRSAGSRSPS